MAELIISTSLNAPYETVADHVLRTSLFEYVARGVLSFRPIDPNPLPEVWKPGAYRLRPYWKGWLPVGHLTVLIDANQSKEHEVLHDQGHRLLLPKWSHRIEIKRIGETTLYTDRLVFDSGWLTPIVRVFVSSFFHHRQRRWRKLVANNFDYSA